MSQSKTETGNLPDKSLFAHCGQCRGSFFPVSTLLKRRCKDCGNVFCRSCTSHRALLTLLSGSSGKRYHVCEGCHMKRLQPPSSFPAASEALRGAASKEHLKALACLLAVECSDAPTAAQHRYAASLLSLIGAALNMKDDGVPILHPLLGPPPTWAADGARVGAKPPGAPGSRVRAVTAAGDAAEAGDSFFTVLPPTVSDRAGLLVAVIKFLRAVGTYDARPRALLRGLCHRLGVPWGDVAAEEDRLAWETEGIRGGVGSGDAGGMGEGAPLSAPTPAAPEPHRPPEAAPVPAPQGAGAAPPFFLSLAPAPPVAATIAASEASAVRGSARSAVVATGAVLGGAAAISLGLAAGGVALPVAGLALGCKAIIVSTAVKVLGIGGGIALVGQNTAAALKSGGGAEDALLVVEALSACATLSEVGTTVLRASAPGAAEAPPPGFALTIGAAGPTFRGAGAGVARSGSGGGGGELLSFFVGPWGGYANSLAAPSPAGSPGAPLPPPAGAPSPPPAAVSAHARSLSAGPLFEGNRVSLSAASPQDEPLLAGWLTTGSTHGGDAYREAFRGLPWHGWDGGELPEAGPWLAGDKGRVFLVWHPKGTLAAAPIGFVAVGPAAPLPARGAATHLSELRICIPDSGLWSDVGTRKLYLGSDALLTAMEAVLMEAVRHGAPAPKFLWRPPESCVAGYSMVNYPSARAFPLCEGDQLRRAVPVPHYECMLSPSRGAVSARRSYMAGQYMDPDEFGGAAGDDDCENDDGGAPKSPSEATADRLLAALSLPPRPPAQEAGGGGGGGGGTSQTALLGNGWWRARGTATGRLSAVMFAPTAQAAFFASLQGRFAAAAAAGGGAPLPPPAPPPASAAPGFVARAALGLSQGAERVGAALGFSRIGIGVRATSPQKPPSAADGGVGGDAPPSRALGLLDGLASGASSLGLATLGFFQFSRGAFLECCEAADAGGEALGRWLLAGGGGRRPVTLVGYGMGARLLFSAARCLGRLAERVERGIDTGAVDGEAPLVSERWPPLFSSAHPRAVLMDVVLLGAPVVASAEEWRLVRSAVAGRVVSAFDGGDPLLRAAALWWGLGGVPCGLQAVGAGGWWGGVAGGSRPPSPGRSSPELSSDEEEVRSGGGGGGGARAPPGTYDTPSHPVADVSADQLARILPHPAARGSALAAGTVFAQWWEGVESVDVGGIVGGRCAWEEKLPDVLEFLGLA